MVESMVALTVADHIMQHHAQCGLLPLPAAEGPGLNPLGKIASPTTETILKGEPVSTEGDPVSTGPIPEALA